SFLLLSFSIILPYLIVDLKLCNRTLENETAKKLLIQFYEEQAADRLQEYVEKLIKNKEISEMIGKRLLLESEKVVKE
ncbi:hypothetical protein SJ942_14310, partial [Enterococcus faecium]